MISRDLARIFIPTLAGQPFLPRIFWAYPEIWIPEFFSKRVKFILGLQFLKSGKISYFYGYF